MKVDVHQHLWPEGLLSALARRSVQPRLRGGFLELAGDPPAPFDADDHDPATRTDFDRVLIAASLPIGIEDHPDLLEAFHVGVLELGAPFALWGSGGDVDALLDAGAVGMTVAGRALGSSHAVLERLEARGAPLFVHPGPASGSRSAVLRRPGWWSRGSPFTSARPTSTACATWVTARG